MSNDTSKKNENNWFARHKVLTAIWVIVFLVIVGAASGGSKSKTKNDGATSAPSTQASQSAAPTPAPTPPAPKVYTGSGDDVVDIQKPADGAAIVKFECPSCTSNTVLKTNGPESLLVNTIGSYSGSSIIDTSSGANTTQATITAAGAWTLTVSGLDQATPVSGQPVNGQGDSVLHVTGGTTKATVTNAGDSNFVVNAYPENGGFANLAVNTIGSYKGTVPIKAPAYVQITSNGAWTFAPN